MARTRFAGLFNAVDFNYGGGLGFPPALVVDSGSQVAGSAGSVLLASQSVTLLDGTIIQPLNTNAPIIAGRGANADIVTPSAIGTPAVPGYPFVSLTFTATHAHGAGDPIQSGTCGLQEALNFAGTFQGGGGIVMVSPAWTMAGGTSAMIAAAVLPAGVTIWDNRGLAAGGSALLQTAQVAITNAQVLAMYGSTPPLLVAAPPAGSLIQVVSMTLEAIYNTAAFTSGGAIQANYGALVAAPATATIPSTFLTSFSANQLATVGGATGVLTKANTVGLGLYLTNASGAFVNGSSGASTLLATVNYRVISGL